MLRTDNTRQDRFAVVPFEGLALLTPGDAVSSDEDFAYAHLPRCGGHIAHGTASAVSAFAETCKANWESTGLHFLADSLRVVVLRSPDEAMLAEANRVLSGAGHAHLIAA